MKTTLVAYIVIGVLFIVPLVLFNIRRIFVRKPPAPMKINWGRAAFVVLFSAFLVFFLVCAYNTTMTSRYEIVTEKIAEMHAKLLTGQASEEEFRAFVVENGTELVEESLDSVDLSDLPGGQEEVRFQLGDRMTPRYWQEEEAFPQTEVLDSESPIYLMYKLEAGGETRFYTLRLRQVEGTWKYDWLGNATDEQLEVMDSGRYLPNAQNGKWYEVGN